MVSFGKQKLWLMSGVVFATCGLAACSSLGTSDAVTDNNTVTPQDFAVADEGKSKLKAIPEQALDAPVGGGAFVERAPYNAMPARFGNASEDMSVAMPIDDIAAMKVLGENDCDDYRFVEMSDKDIKKDLAKESNKDIKSAHSVKRSGNPSLVRGLEISDTVTEVATNNNSDTEDWLAPEGSSLRSLLMDWGDRAGWKVVWKSDREYLLEAGAVFRGRYMDVTAALVRTFARARPAPIATFYKGNKVLLITTLEDENAD